MVVSFHFLVVLLVLFLLHFKLVSLDWYLYLQIFSLLAQYIILVFHLLYPKLELFFNSLYLFLVLLSHLYQSNLVLVLIILWAVLDCIHSLLITSFQLLVRSLELAYLHLLKLNFLHMNRDLLLIIAPNLLNLIYQLLILDFDFFCLHNYLIIVILDSMDFFFTFLKLEWKGLFFIWHIVDKFLL